jgi:hypothetical protein
LTHEVQAYLQITNPRVTTNGDGPSEAEVKNTVSSDVMAYSLVNAKNSSTMKMEACSSETFVATC